LAVSIFGTEFRCHARVNGYGPREVLLLLLLGPGFFDVAFESFWIWVHVAAGTIQHWPSWLICWTMNKVLVVYGAVFQTIYV
jgi:hypothetical protein